MRVSATFLAVYLGILAAFLQLLDWFLSDSIKEKITNLFLVIWVWLDEQKSGKFIAAVWTVRVQTILSLIYIVPITIGLLWWTGENIFFSLAGSSSETIPTFIILTVIIAGAMVIWTVAGFLLLHRKVLKTSEDFTTTWTFFRFTIRQAFIHSMSVPVFVASYVVIGRPILLSLPETIITVVLLPFFFEATALWCVICVSCCWMALAWALGGILRLLSILLERALSQKRGVLAALSALFLVVATLLKFS